MENVLPVSVDHSRTKLDNYNDENVKQQFSPCNQSNKVNVELGKSLREQIENL